MQTSAESETRSQLTQASQSLEHCADVVGAAATGSARSLADACAAIFRATATAFAVADEWPEVALAQARAAYEAARVSASTFAQHDDGDGEAVAACSRTRDELKQVLGTLEGEAAPAPPATERDLPRVDDDALGLQP